MGSAFSYFFLVNNGVIVQEFYAKKGLFTKQIATEGFSTVFGQLISPLYHTKSIKPRKFGNIVQFAIE